VFERPLICRRRLCGCADHGELGVSDVKIKASSPAVRSSTARHRTPTKTSGSWAMSKRQTRCNQPHDHRFFVPGGHQHIHRARTESPPGQGVGDPGVR